MGEKLWRTIALGRSSWKGATVYMAVFTKLLNCSSISLMLRLILLLVLSMRTKGLVKLPPNVSIPAVIGFGDSIIDPGNNNKIKTLIKCNFPPYGKDFEGGIPTGRFCNGKIPSDMLGTYTFFSLHIAFL